MSVQDLSEVILAKDNNIRFVNIGACHCRQCNEENELEQKLHFVSRLDGGEKGAFQCPVCGLWKMCGSWACECDRLDGKEKRSFPDGG